MNKVFPKNFDYLTNESKWYTKWQKNKIYSKENKDAEPYSILMPPPNVTGILHFGHVLNHTLQDLYIRRKRMQGFDSCWFPGMDHAGIATQSKVERVLKEEEGLTRHDLGREKFVERVLEWKEKYGGIIFKQLERLGISANWDKFLFTMDDTASKAVQEVFIRLFDEGLIYKGKRIINWSPLSQTALSDEEVEWKEVNEHFYTLRYYFENSDKYLSVSTVRPETIYGDVAVAVNPKDERFSNMIGKNLIVPYVGRKIPVIADNYADPEFGTGCVKITPAHDPNDFEVGKRHDLEMINTINPDGTMNELAGELNGIERFEARKIILEKLKENDLVEKIEDYAHNLGFSQRGGEPIEPFLSDQWFVNMKPLAELALDDVMSDNIKFYPSHWKKTYEHWMTNIRDWCISRQLWWGHRIPVYYSKDGKFTAANNVEEARNKLGLDSTAILKQDEDVLDTWFSSWIWPMTTMRWLKDNNEDNKELDKFLSTDLLVTGPDIIFFWVARMIMATKKFKAKIPFKNVYFTSMIRDGKGRKLSKSLGNSPDPLIIFDKYGVDAVRFTMLYLSPLGQDVRMDVNVDKQDIPSMEIGRNFANKVWNAGRFLLMKRDLIENRNVNNETLLSKDELSLADKWIISKLNSTIIKIDDALDNYKVTEYSKLLYEFIWKDFCDWYVEIVKVEFSANSKIEYQTRLMNTTIDIYNKIINLLHPVMPYITEEIWHLISNNDPDSSLSLEKASKSELKSIDNELENKFEIVQSIVEEIRKLKSTSLSISPTQKLPVIISTKNDDDKNYLNKVSEIIKVLGKCSEITIDNQLEKPNTCLATVIRGIEIFIVLEGAIDLSTEKTRFEKEKERLIKQIEGINKKLTNKRFIDNAPEKVILMERKKLTDMSTNLEKIEENLKGL